MSFHGAKLVLLIGGRLVTLQRDDRPDIPWPGLWDLPGGGREGDETPQDCVLRELREELSIVLPAQALVWQRAYEAPRRAWFFGAHLNAGAEAHIRLGDEGQQWALMDPQDWLAQPDVVPHFRSRVRDALASLLA